MIAVLGSTGRVGGAVVGALASLGAPVRAIVRDPDGVAPRPGGALVEGDLRQPSCLVAAVAGADAVFLLRPVTDPSAARGLGWRVAKVLAGASPRVVYLSALAAEGQPAR
jgi:uncharacterized protein YbjT (DUF2867 family)